MSAGRPPFNARQYTLPPPVVFPSLEFAIFFPLVLILSWALMPHPRPWKPFVLVASYVFYGAASAKFCLLLAVVTLANQAGAVPCTGRRASSGGSCSARPPWRSTSACSASTSTTASSSTSSADCWTRRPRATTPVLNIALPIGLSFYTFQAISYVVDVKRGGDRAGADCIDVAIYLSFFPHVVAGPIVRAKRVPSSAHHAARHARRGRGRRPWC